MQKRLWKKGFVFVIVLLFFGISMQSSTQRYSTVRSSESCTVNPLTQSSSDNTTHYYAVICACSRYQNPSYNLPKVFPGSESKLRVLYEALLQTKNWDQENIILLLNKNATKHNITDALERMSVAVGPNDIFLFTWNGHGSEVPDINGDEAQWDQNDTYDEVICPYDIEKNNDTFLNVITDDELGYYFSNIHAKGKCLIFESCLSGDLVDKKTSNIEDVQIYHEGRELTLFETDFLQEIMHPKTLDVNDNNTIVIMSTLPDVIGLASYLTQSPLLYSVAKTISHSENSDNNHDGYLSAEEIFQTSRPLTLIQSALFYLNLYFFTLIYIPLIYKFFISHFLTLFPPLLQQYYLKTWEKILSKPIAYITYTTFIFPVILIFQQLFTKAFFGHYAFNWPNMQDDYPGELPLVQL